METPVEIGQNVWLVDDDHVSRSVITEIAYDRDTNGSGWLINYSWEWETTAFASKKEASNALFTIVKRQLEEAKEKVKELSTLYAKLSLQNSRL